MIPRSTSLSGFISNFTPNHFRLVAPIANQSNGISVISGFGKSGMAIHLHPPMLLKKMAYNPWLTQEDLRGTISIEFEF
jgi:hypothetical protein